jgi:hypothetical protein
MPRLTIFMTVLGEPEVAAEEAVGEPFSLHGEHPLSLLVGVPPAGSQRPPQRTGPVSAA